MTVVAENPGTLEALRDYLRGAGLVSHGARALGGATGVPQATSAVVLFPDDFDADEIVGRISSLRAARPRLLVIVITRRPQRLRPALDADGRSLLPIVLPIPAFGWTILDAIRAFAQVKSP